MSVGIGAFLGESTWVPEIFGIFLIIFIIFLIKTKAIYQSFRKKARKITNFYDFRQCETVLSGFKFVHSSFRANLAILLLCINFMIVGINTVNALNIVDNELEVTGTEDLALVEGEKVAIVVIPQDAGEFFTVTLSNQSILILGELGYQIVRVEERTDICRIQASQVVVLYTGHGVTDPANTLFLISGEQIHLSEIIENIEAERLILLTNACYGGSWLEFQAEDRLIISVVNDTVCQILGIAWQSKKGIRWEFKGSILELIEGSKNSPIECIYEKWRIDVIQFYETQDIIGIHPVIYDGITGDVWL